MGPSSCQVNQVAQAIVAESNVSSLYGFPMRYNAMYHDHLQNGLVLY